MPLSSLVNDIWTSLRALPLWVQLWIFCVLVPINLASVFFLNAPQGVLIAVLAVLGIAPNAVILLVQRGFPKSMAFSHLIFWPPLLVVLLPYLGAPYATALFTINAISIAFDVNDARAWLLGDRRVPGR